MGSERDPGLVEPVRDTTRRVCRPDRECPDEPSGPVQLSDLNPVAEAAASSCTSGRTCRGNCWLVCVEPGELGAGAWSLAGL